MSDPLMFGLLAGIGIGLWLALAVFVCGGWVRLNMKRDDDIATNSVTRGDANGQ